MGRKTYKLSVSAGVQKQVLWLQVPVDDAFAMEVLECLQHTGKIESSCAVVKVRTETE